MDRVAFLETERLSLYKMDEDHCNNTYLSWLHNKQVSKYLETGRYPESLESLRVFIDSHHSKNVIFLAIHLRENDVHIGNIKIDNISTVHQTGEYGLLIGDTNAWRKGYAKEASAAVIQHCFDRLNLRKITLGVIEENTGALKLYEDKLNFVREGHYKSHLFCDGKYVDVIRMATFREQWL